MLDDIKRTYESLIDLRTKAAQSGNKTKLLFLNNHIIKLRLDIVQLSEKCHLFKKQLEAYRD